MCIRVMIYLLVCKNNTVRQEITKAGVRGHPEIIYDMLVLSILSHV